MDGTDETQQVTPPPTHVRLGDNVTTAAFDAPPQRVRPASIALVFCAVAAAGFLIGIAVAAGTRPAPPPVGEITAQQVVGPSGGTIRFDDGQIQIPPDALAQPVRIVVRRSSFTDRVRVLPPAGSPEVFDPGGLSAYTFGPTSIDFRRPVQIVFRLPVAAGNGTVFARSNNIVILGGIVDADRQTVTVTVRNFRFNRRTTT